MLNLPIPTICAWINGLLLTGCVISAGGGVFYIARAPRFTVFSLRQRSRRRGWKLLVLSAGFLLALGLMLALGQPGLEYLRGLAQA